MRLLAEISKLIQTYVCGMKLYSGFYGFIRLCGRIFSCSALSLQNRHYINRINFYNRIDTLFHNTGCEIINQSTIQNLK